MRSIRKQIPERIEVRNHFDFETISDSVLGEETSAPQKRLKQIRRALEDSYRNEVYLYMDFGLAIPPEPVLREAAFIDVLHKYHLHHHL